MPVAPADEKKRHLEITFLYGKQDHPGRIRHERRHPSLGAHQQNGIRERVGSLGERRNNPQQPVGTSGVRFPGQQEGLHKRLCRRHDPDQAVFDQQRRKEDIHDPGNRCRGFPLG